MRWALLVAGVMMAAASAWAQAPLPPAMQGLDAEDRPTVLPPAMQAVDVEEHLDRKIPLDLAFTSSRGAQVTLRDFFQDGKPVLLVLAYYRCPQLCNLMINGVTDSIEELGWKPGDEFNAVTLSIDPRELVVDASRKQDVVLAELGVNGEHERWPFLIGRESEIKTLATALGFSYAYDERTDQYAHAAVIFVLTPDGRISRYLYGTEFPARDMKLALVEAGEGKTGSFLDKLILTCFHYDPVLKRYGPYIFGFLRIGAALIALVVAAFVLRLWRRERRENA